MEGLGQVGFPWAGRPCHRACLVQHGQSFGPVPVSFFWECFTLLVESTCSSLAEASRVRPAFEASRSRRVVRHCVLKDLPMSTLRASS